MLTLKVISLYQDDDVCRDVELSVGKIEGVSIESRPVKKLLAQLEAIDTHETCDVLFIELSDQMDGDLMDAVEAQLARIAESVAVFVSFPVTNIMLIRRMIRIGVRDVIPQPLDRNDLINQVTAVLSEKRARLVNTQGSLSSVFSFINAKGGSGASTLAVNVAAQLAQKYKMKVALIDLDLQLGIVDLLLDIVPKSSVQDAISQSHRVDPVFLKALMTRHGSGLDVLPSPGGLTSIAEVGVEDVRRVLDAAAEAYEVVIVDLPRVFTGWTVEVMKLSEKVMLVVQNALPTLKDAKVILDNLPSLGVSRQVIEVVNNRAESSMGSVTIQELKTTLNIERIHRIRTDFRAASSAQNQGKVVAAVAPSSKMSRDIDNLARYLHLSVIHPGEDPTGRVHPGFWKKITGRTP